MKNEKNTKQIGNTGETIAVEYLQKSGYKILERNWNYKHKEIDVIAMKDNECVIVEVKTRNEHFVIHPLDAVTKKKQRYLVEAANSYIIENDIDVETRFDIITVILKKDAFEIEHIEEAFYPLV